MDPFVHVQSAADLREAVRVALDRIGMSYADLEAQHRRGWYDSDLVRRTWVAIGGLSSYARD